MAGRRVPEVHCLVLAGRGEEPAIWTECHTKNDARMSPVSADHLASRRIPDGHYTISVSRDQPPPSTRAKRHAPDFSCLWKDEQHFARRHIPNLYGVIFSGRS